MEELSGKTALVTGSTDGVGANTARYTKMDAKRFDGFWQD
jgi:short-subunit dehydrogenase